MVKIMLQYVLLGLSLLQECIATDTMNSPGCALKCWDNSKYVTTCPKVTTVTTVTENACLCEDAQFQNAVLQCLYSQCQTTQFGSALHYTMMTCASTDMDTTDVLPPLIRHQGLRKRGIPTTGVISGHVSASAVHSLARRSVSASAFRQPYINRVTPTSTAQVPFSSSSALTISTGAPVNYQSINGTTAPSPTKTN